MYLYSRFHLSLAIAAFDAAVYPQIASMGGSVFGGYLADKFTRRTPRSRVLVQCIGVLSGAPFVIVCGLSGSLIVVKFSLLFWGFFKGMYDSNIFASAFDVVPVESRGTASGLMNCVGWLLGGGLAPVLVGYLAIYLSLGNAIALSSMIYVLGGLLMILAMRRFLANDIRQAQIDKRLIEGQ